MASHKKRKIAAVRKLFKQREQVATSQFVTALERLRKERGKDADMQEYLFEYRDRYQTGTSSGMPARLVKGWKRFLISLEDASQVQRLQTEKAQQYVETARVHVVSSRLRVRAGEKLQQRLQDTLAREAARKERRQLDELTKQRRLSRD